jgi:hypothetical protein
MMSHEVFMDFPGELTMDSDRRFERLRAAQTSSQTIRDVVTAVRLNHTPVRVITQRPREC